MDTQRQTMNHLFNNIFEQYVMYAIKEINPNLPAFDYNFQKICRNLDVSKWYNILKLKPLPELEMILQALLESNFNYLNSDPIHSAIVLDLKAKIEQTLDSLDADKTKSLDLEKLKSKIQSHPYTIGYIAIHFDYNSNFKFDAKEFCLASFKQIVHEKNGVNWPAKLNYYVEEMELTKLYVYGKNVANMLKKHLNIPVICIRLQRNKKLEYCHDCNKAICTVRQIKIYFKKLHSFFIHYDCR